jgi:hypothetical protein
MSVGCPSLLVPAALLVGSFPATRHSVVERLASSDPQTRRVAFDALVSAYGVRSTSMCGSNGAAIVTTRPT